MSKRFIYPSSRKIWATVFCSIAARGFFLKFAGSTFVTTSDLTVLAGLAATAVGWYSLGVFMDNKLATSNKSNILDRIPGFPQGDLDLTAPTSKDPNEMYVENS